mmetsp:Transcript_23948/g.47031  ORF Transcript_23948/g.47031 Transcript_23948/m.47031 type:complete len:81 (-) Transcript_23948:1912-2154(-)
MHASSAISISNKGFFGIFSQAMQDEKKKMHLWALFFRTHFFSELLASPHCAEAFFSANVDETRLIPCQPQDLEPLSVKLV